MLTPEEDVLYSTTERTSSVKLHFTCRITYWVQARREGALVTLHCENHDAINWMTEKLLNAGLTDPKASDNSAPCTLCERARGEITLHPGSSRDDTLLGVC